MNRDYLQQRITVIVEAAEAVEAAKQRLRSRENSRTDIPLLDQQARQAIDRWEAILQRRRDELMDWIGEIVIPEALEEYAGMDIDNAFIEHINNGG